MGMGSWVLLGWWVLGWWVLDLSVSEKIVVALRVVVEGDSCAASLGKADMISPGISSLAVLTTLCVLVVVL